MPDELIRIWTDIEGARRTILRRQDMMNLDDVPERVQASIRKVFGEELTPADAVRRILKDVRTQGDAALREWTQRIDALELDDFAIPPPALKDSYERLPGQLRDAMEQSAARIRAFHEHQPIASWTTNELGGTLGQRVEPLERVGIYVPGGTAPLPSSLLMAAVPAQVAGVDEIVVCTPPGQPNGDVPEIILAAAHIAGVDEVYRLGGAQAIAAMTFGTESVRRVDKIVGAGGLFTTLAKQQVFGIVGLDGIYGPTETVVIADESANPAWVAADLLAQAEHDVLATAILLTPSKKLAQEVQAEISQQVDGLSRGEIIATSLRYQGGIVVTPDLETATQLADEFAPEHLCLSVEEPAKWAQRIRNAGGIFLGEHSFEVLGDYVAGPSHIMPTGGTARFSSPVNVLDFVKIISIVALERKTAAEISGVAARIAKWESLTAHAAAATARMDNTKQHEP